MLERTIVDERHVFKVASDEQGRAALVPARDLVRRRSSPL
jgi:hypothetical protein